MKTRRVLALFGTSPAKTDRAARGLACLVLAVLLAPGLRVHAAPEVMARWSFEEPTNASTITEVSRQPDRLAGYYHPAAGIGSGAIQLDGYTGFLERARFGLELPPQFTINACLALESYPWFRSPVFDLRRAEKDGVLLGVNHAGRLVMALGQP